VVRGVIEDGDTIPLIVLDNVYIFSKKKFKNKRAKIRYTKLVRDVRIVYPYAKKAGIILRKIDVELTKLEKRKDERKYVKTLEVKLKKEFEKELRNLTITQGKILVLLLDRETGHTCHYLIKELKGSLMAFFWQNIGRIFGYNLKNTYDPDLEKDIESIVISIEHG